MLILLELAEFEIMGRSWRNSWVHFVITEGGLWLCFEQTLLFGPPSFLTHWVRTTYLHFWWGWYKYRFILYCYNLGEYLWHVLTFLLKSKLYCLRLVSRCFGRQNYFFNYRYEAMSTFLVAASMGHNTFSILRLGQLWNPHFSESFCEYCRSLYVF